MNLVPLSEVCKIVNGGTPKSGVAAYWGGDVAWLTPAEMGKLDSPEIVGTARTITAAGLKDSSAKQVPVGSVIMSTRAPIGHLAIPLAPMAFNQGCRGLVPNARLDTKYLYYFLWLSRESLNDLGTGTTFKELSTGALGSYKIPLPLLEEQGRIVTVLDKAFAATGTATANAEKNKVAVDGLLSNLVESILAAEPDRMPMTLADAADATCTLSYGIVQPGSDVEGGLPIVRPVDLQQKIIGLDGLKRIDPFLAASYKRTTLKGGEVLLCVRGTTGVLSLASDELMGANVTRGIVPIRFDPSVIDRAFGYYLMRSGAIQKQIRAATYGTALMQINIADLRKLKIEAPSLERQAILRERLDRLSAEISDLQENCVRKLEAYTDLKQSLLRQAFSGNPIGTQLLAA